MAFNVDEKYILAAEAELKVQFPESFRRKMMQVNGGAVFIPYPNETEEGEIFFLYPFFDSSDKKRISRTCNDIVRETKLSREKYGLEEHLIVIGSDQSKCWLVLRIEDDGVLGRAVYILPFGSDTMYKVAQDFSELQIESN